jgi:geranylgeranyl transferase type-2 subunit beta
MDRLDWISEDKLAGFIAKAQDPDDGGIADRPEDMPDIFHTFFGIAGLSLLGKLPDSYRTIDPVYALPTDVVRRCCLTAQVIRRSVSDGGDGRLQQYDALER